MNGVQVRITEQDIAAYKREVMDKTVLVTAHGAASMLAVSERTVRRLAEEGELTEYRREEGVKGLRFLASELREYVGSLKVVR